MKYRLRMKWSVAVGRVSIGSLKVAVILKNESNAGSGCPIAGAIIRPVMLNPGGVALGGSLWESDGYL
ncbi:MAG: hypothetical protein PHZ03_01035 [Syntrophomonas sp.]|nr:hypothetical protein [Syntrophomonas sp.]